jgi:hypothetical protein
MGLGKFILFRRWVGVEILFVLDVESLCFHKSILLIVNDCCHMDIIITEMNHETYPYHRYLS